MDRPVVITDAAYRFDAFTNGEVVENKKKNYLPAMGWNSWNAFGSGNTEALTKAMADKFIELGLDKLGYRYIVLDDGCYKPARVDGLLSNEEIKFPSGFRGLADYIHGKGLKFGMYNDIGTNLCAGAEVGTCGYEMVDARTYIDWGVDFIKVDNCYYLWDNATFSNKENARYTYAPRIRSILLKTSEGEKKLAVSQGYIYGNGIVLKEDYVENIGTYDGTGPENTPVGPMSCELRFELEVSADTEAELYVEYASGREAGIGSWLQVAVETGKNVQYAYDDFLPETADTETFTMSQAISLSLADGKNVLRLMNHRRQENTLNSYAALQKGFYEAKPDHDIILSICEWGKTQPQNWGYKTGDSWRILNDITFRVGADGDPGHGAWDSDYTTGVAVQYNKAVIMDEFAGLDKGWNDPDMMMIGMEGLNETQCRTHMLMWCMLNSPLMLGLDLRRVEKGDWIYRIITDKNLIDLNQDALGIQAKRIYSTLDADTPDTNYIRDLHRIDVLAKPLSDGNIALSFINVSEEDRGDKVSVEMDRILKYIGKKMVDSKAFEGAEKFLVKDLASGEEQELYGREFSVEGLPACGEKTYKISVI